MYSTNIANLKILFHWGRFTIRKLTEIKKLVTFLNFSKLIFKMAIVYVIKWKESAGQGNDNFNSDISFVDRY